MQKTFSATKVQRLRREAKAISEAMDISHSEALESIARREGYKDWGLLAHNANRVGLKQPEVAPGVTNLLTSAAFEEVMSQFFKTLSAAGVRNLCGGGASLWVPADEVAAGTLNYENIAVLGAASEGFYKRYAREQDLLLVVDYDGMGAAFVFPEDVDDDGIPIQPGPASVKFTTFEGRAQLLDDLHAHADDYFERLIERFNELLGES